MKPKILIFSDWYLPAYKAGGPVKSVSNLVNALSENFDFDIFTSDRDFGDPEPFPDREKDTWLEIRPGVRIFYFSKEKLFPLLKKLLADESYRIIYLNSLYSIRFSFIPLLVARYYDRKVILAPRGMLGKGALSIKKGKKQVFIAIYRLLGLDKFVKWQATSLEEYREIKTVFENAQVRIIPNIPSPQDSVSRTIIKSKNNLRLCFISRISEKKNLFYALESLAQLDRELTMGIQLDFDIYGPVEDAGYWEKCSRIIKQTDWKHSKINYSGEVKPEEVFSILSAYHFLFLPTRNENFGHIIYESLNAGVPVVISDQTPWRNLGEKNIGFDFNLSDTRGLLKILRTCLDMDQEQYTGMKNAVKEFVNKMDLRKESIDKSVLLFGEEIKEKKRPGSRFKNQNSELTIPH